MFKLIQQIRDNYKYVVEGEHLLLHKKDNSAVLDSILFPEKFIQTCEFVVFGNYLLVDNRDESFWVYENHSLIEIGNESRLFFTISLRGQCPH